MDQSTFDRLEFSAVLAHVAALAQCAAARRDLLTTRPWTDLATIRHHADAVDEMQGLLDSGRSIPIAGLDDCGDVLEQLEPPSAFLDPPDWQRLSGFLAQGAELRRAVHELRERFPVCWALAQAIDPLRPLVTRIAEVFDAEGEVRDSASDALRSIRGKIRRLAREIERVFERILSKNRDSDVLQENFSTERAGRRVVPVRAGARGRLPGIVHDTSGSGETLFVEPFEAVGPSNQLAEERTREREEVVRILVELACEARGHLEDLRANRAALVQLDLWHARAQLAFRHHLRRPAIEPGATLLLNEAHHPLLYLNDAARSIPLNIRLAPENRALVITGPNTGGKTTALKTVGLAALMAQSAIPVPAAVDSRLPLFDQVLAEMGDDQSVSAGLSTFSAHIRRISWILEHARADSLILLDELGKATDPLQAGALGRAILEALIERGALTFVTTHLPTLKEWAHDHPAGRNASYRLDPTTHRPLFEIHMDTPGISEAFTIAEAEGLPRAVVEAAIARLPKEERELSELLETLHLREKELAEEREAMLAARAHTETVREALRKERDELAQAKLEADLQLETRYKALLDKAREDLEKRIANLPSRQALSQARAAMASDQKAAEKRLDELHKREERILERAAPPQVRAAGPWQPAAGDWVRVGKGEQVGRIEKIDAPRKRATLTVGGLEVSAPLRDLIRATEPVEARLNLFGGGGGKSGVRYTVDVARQSVRPEIDLHGQRVEAALENLDKYLDEAVLAHMGEVRIVHGHGTGALRSAIQEFLRSHPHARRTRFADPREGGVAVTIVTLK